MLLQSSLGEAYSVLQSVVETRLDDLYPSASSVVINQILLPQELQEGTRVEDQKTLITPAPSLNPRNPAPQNGDDCAAQASQSASQAIQQASQAASESIRQASQSASDQIRDASNSASQTIVAASRSMSALSSSASSAISRALSAQAEASLAISRARAVIASGTGSAGTASSASSTQTVALSATQAALAILGSIFASTLITVLIVYLLFRHKNKKSAAKRSRSQSSSSSAQSPRYQQEPKFTFTDQNGTTIADSLRSHSRGKDSQRGYSESSLSMFPEAPTFGKPAPQEFPAIKTTSVPWNPAQPPKVPNLGDWLKNQDAVSPFGPIKLPIDDSPNAPLGGQLKSPHQSTAVSSMPEYSNDLPLRAGKAPGLLKVERVTIRPVRNISSTGKLAVKKSGVSPPNLPSPLAKIYRDAKATVWADSPPVTSSQKPTYKGLTPGSQESTKQKSSINGEARRATPEWFALREETSTTETPENDAPVISNQRPGFPLKPWPSNQLTPTEQKEGDGRVVRDYRRPNRLSSYLGAASRRGQSRPSGVGTAV